MASTFRSCKRSCNPENVIDSQIPDLDFTFLLAWVRLSRGCDLVLIFLTFVLTEMEFLSVDGIIFPMT